MHWRLEKASEAIDVATRDLTTEQLADLPPGRWSNAQILEHLALAFRLNAAGLERVCDSGRPRFNRPSLSQLAAQWLVLHAGYFPRVKSPEPIAPTGSIAPHEVRQATHDALVALDAAAARAARQFGEGPRLVRHPYLGGLTTEQWLKFHWRHTVHHMRQIRAVSRG
jgi:hypothetical protein